MSDAQAPNIIEHPSSLSFADTLDRLEQAVSGAGMTIFARIDHAANARAVGLTMPPSTVLIYGAAKGGTPIMLDNSRAALDLPLRVLVREEEDGRVVIAFHPVAAMLGRAGVARDVAARLEPAQHLLLKAVAP